MLYDTPTSHMTDYIYFKLIFFYFKYIQLKNFLRSEIIMKKALVRIEKEIPLTIFDEPVLQK